jgi:lipid A 3-O-deacylase
MRTATVMAVALMYVSAPLAIAGDNALEVRFGERGGITYEGVSLRGGELWARDAGRWSMRLQPVAEAGRFRYGGSRATRDSLTYGGLGVGFRLAYERALLRPYLELGLGGALLSQTTLGPRTLSTRFQFTEWIGVGVDISEHFTVGMRFSHYSNAGIKKPNDGLDMQQIVIGARF